MYRAVFDHGPKYLKACKNLSLEDYKTTEYHGDTGLDGKILREALELNGFEVVVEHYHWEGMGPVASVLTGLGITKILSGRGLAPVVRFIARKK